MRPPHSSSRLRSSSLLALTAFAFVTLAACTAPTTAQASAPEAPVDIGDVDVDADLDTEVGTNATPADAPRLTIDAQSRDLGALHVMGSITNAAASPRFRLRAADGCARDVDLAATSTPSSETSTGFSLAMREAEIADAYACVVDVELTEGEPGASVTVTPDAEIVHASPALAFDTFSVASLDLEPVHGGEILRVAVLAKDVSVKHASMTVLGTTALGTMAPAGDLDDDRDGASYTRITFEIPTKVWARASIAHASTTVHVIDETNRAHDIDATAKTRIEVMSDDEPGC